MNRDSDNFTAEMLLKQLGTPTAAAARARGGRGRDRSDAEAGIPAAGVRIVDGSGLSTSTASRPSPRRRAPGGHRRPRASGRRSSAPWPSRGERDARAIACQPRGPGPRQDRHDQSRLHPLGLLPAPVAFAVLQNGTPVASWPARAAQDRFVTTLAFCRDCQGASNAASERAGQRVAPSSSTGTPAFSAFAGFEPGLSPTITPVVFFDTESETFAPSASSAAFASSRVKPSSVPVITYWRR